MFKVLISPDSFKGSVDARAAAAAIARGVRLVCPDAVISELPIADGGEGTLDDAENTTTKPTYIMKNIRELYENI